METCLTCMCGAQSWGVSVSGFRCLKCGESLTFADVVKLLNMYFEEKRKAEKKSKDLMCSECGRVMVYNKNDATWYCPQRCHEVVKEDVNANSNCKA